MIVAGDPGFIPHPRRLLSDIAHYQTRCHSTDATASCVAVIQRVLSCCFTLLPRRLHHRAIVVMAALGGVPLGSRSEGSRNRRACADGPRRPRDALSENRVTV